MNGSWSLWWIAVVLLIQALDLGPHTAKKPDNALTSEEKKDGWILLFDGKSLDGWQTSSGQPSKVPVEDGCINPHGSGGYMMIHQKTWANFVLSLDFKISKGCNSGVFIRTYPLTPGRARMSASTASRSPSTTPGPPIFTTPARSTTWSNRRKTP